MGSEMCIRDSAHAFVLTRPFLTASIVGATQLWRLDRALEALDFEIDEEVQSRLEALHRQYLVPAP